MQENTSMDDFIKDGFSVMVEATKNSNSLPTGNSWTYYSVHESFSKFMESESDRILQLMNRLLRKQEIDESLRKRDIHEKTELIIEANDIILEKVANNIDELNGIKKKQVEQVEVMSISAQIPVNGSWNRLDKISFSVNSPSSNEKQSSLNSVTLLAGKNIIRPQTFFKDKIDNSCHPWIPRITDKPNSLKPLAIFLEETEFGPLYSHPYEFELERFQPSSEQLLPVDPILPKPLEETPLLEINTEEQLNSLLENLRQQKEIAIDLEHHSYRSFMGITCLLQISTVNTDYIIDTFALRDKLHILNEVFTKPSIVKIFHGAICDIDWLQRDLSLYVLNMFDTHIAAKELGYPGLSLSFLLQKYCNVTPNKHFQLADWRIRPLPTELKTYARIDTHFLIYIYQMMRNELLKKANGNDNLLKSVIHKSTQLCMKRYVKPILTDDSHLDFYRKSKRIFDNRQMYALKELYRWRDTIARKEDESTGYVLPNHMLLQIAETLPREMQGILACCNPIPALIRSNLLELHQFILKAREQPLIKPILKESSRSRGSTQPAFKINIESPLHCPHDMSKQQEFRDDLPTLLSDNLQKIYEYVDNSDHSLEKSESSIPLFSSVFTINKDAGKSSAKIKSLKFLGPFERYQLVKSYIASEIAKEMENKDKENKNQKLADEDRISALHEHFKKVSKEIPQKKPENVQTILTEEVVNNFVPTASEGDNKKRKRSEDVKDNSLKVSAPSEPHIKKEKDEIDTVRKRKNKEENFWKNTEAFEKQRKRQKHNDQINENDSNSVENVKKPLSKNKQKKLDWIKRKLKRREIQETQNSSFKPFDYSSVDYSEFKNNESVHKQNQFKSKFKGKGKNAGKSSKNHNKSMTYKSNSRGNQSKF